MSRMMIEKRAYEIWEAEGRPSGRAEVHWATAERELTAAPGLAPEAASPASPSKPASKARAPKAAAKTDKAPAVPGKAAGRRKREEP